jgi:autotransporter-associated beta strand protein
MRRKAITLATMFCGSLAGRAYGDIVYNYVSDTPTPTLSSGTRTATIHLYLQETLSGNSTSLIQSDDGLLGAAMTVGVSGAAGSNPVIAQFAPNADPTFNGNSNPNGFTGGAQISLAPTLLQFAELNGISNNLGVVGTPNGNVTRVLLGNVTIGAGGSMPGQSSTFTFGQYKTGGFTITNDSLFDLDTANGNASGTTYHGTTSQTPFSFVVTNVAAGNQLSWDPSHTPASPSGTTGTWDATAKWSNTSSDVAWPGAATVSDANFRSAGTYSVTVSGNQTAHDLNIYSGNVTFTGGTLTLNDNAGGFASNTAGINVALNSSATISNTTTIAQSSGGGGFFKGGDGTLFLGGVSAFNNLSGLVVNAGALDLGALTPFASANLAIQDLGDATAVIQGNGSFTRALGTGAGQVQWIGGAGGGFAAKGGQLTVNIGGAGAALAFNAANFAATGNQLVFGSATSDSNVLFQNGLNLSNAQQTITVNGASSGANVATISGDITSNAGSLIKAGGGSLSLTGNNTYKLGTTIASGSLRANNAAGSATGSGEVDVNGGSLGGNGTINSGTNQVIVNPGGTITAGADALTTGKLATNSQTWNGGGAYLWKVSGNGSGTAGSSGANGYDLLGMTANGNGTGTGLLVANAGGTTPFTIAISGNSTIPSGAAGKVNNVFTIAQVSGGVTINSSTFSSPPASPVTLSGASGAFVLDTSNFKDNGSSFPSSAFALTLVTDPNNASLTDLQLTYNSTPEPGTALLLLAGGTPFLMTRRRRRARIA